jgi:hypothetical protein
MAAAGDLSAIETLAKARAQAMAPARPKDPAFAEAMRDATDILTWRLGPNRPGWRVYRLAQVLIERHG